jgi:hypothetical protein
MVSYIARVYADLIRKNKKNFKDVKPEIKEEVKQVLIEINREDLIEE